MSDHVINPSTLLEETFTILEMPTKARMPHIYLYLLLSTLAEFIFAAPSCLAVSVSFMFSEWSGLSSQSHPRTAPSSPQCDFLINTFPLAFVCLSLFFFLRHMCSRSSLLLPLLHVLLLSLLFSHFLLFLFSCHAGRRPFAFGVRRATREKDLQAKQQESGRCRPRKQQNSFGISKSTAA